MAAATAKCALRNTRFLSYSRRKLLFTSLCLPGTRNFLSEAYMCDNEWEQRLQLPVIQKLKMSNYMFELDRKFHSEKIVSAIDVDILVNGVNNQVELLEEVEELVHRFRRTPGTIHAFPSTSHAVIRTFLQNKLTDPLMRMLNDRVNYGIFPDDYALNMMMDHFIQEKNYRDAAKVAIFLMLQEDFNNPITCSLALYSCHMYLRNPQPEPWDPDAEPPPPVEEEAEEVWKRVLWIPRAYFDDHFDLRDPKKLIGKTLALIGKEYPDNVGNTSQLIGWAMFEKWDRLQAFLEQLLASEDQAAILKEGVEKFEQIVAEIPDDEGKTREGIQERFSPLLQKLKEKGCVKDEDLIQTLSEKVKQTVKNQEAKDIENVKALYLEWSKQRQDELDRQLAHYYREERIKLIKEKKKELAEKEDRLFFFENIEKHRLNIPPEEEDEMVNVEGKFSGKSLFDVPPEMEGKDGRWSAGIIEEHEPWWRWKEERERKQQEKESAEKKKKKY